jgi:hypothetical protein
VIGCGDVSPSEVALDCGPFVSRQDDYFLLPAPEVIGSFSPSFAPLYGQLAQPLMFTSAAGR